MSDKTVTQLATMKLPTASIDFLRRNPELAQKAGKLMCSLIEVNEVRKAIISLFREPELLKPLIKDGTEQELNDFVEAALAGQDDAIKFNNLPPGAFERIVEKMGDSMLSTDVGQPLVVNGPDNKEVSEPNP